MRAAAHDARAQLLDLAADMFEIAASDLTLEDGEIRSVDGTLRRPITEVTGKLGNAWVDRRAARARPTPTASSVNTFGCQIAQVAVDTHTGVARSSGSSPCTTSAGSSTRWAPAARRWAASSRASATR